MRFIAFLFFLTLIFQNKDKGLDLNYDKAKNQTVASTAPIEVKLRDSFLTKDFDFKVQCIFEGQYPVARPESAYLVFRALSHRWRFLEESERQASFLIDGMRFSPSSKPNYTSVVGEKFLDETLIYEVKISDVERIARASNIEIQIGEVVGRLKEKQVGKIKDFLDRVSKP